MQEVTVMVSSCGSTSGVNVIKALRKQDRYAVTLVGTDADPDAAGLKMVDMAGVLPMASDYRFLEEVLSICKRHDVDVRIQFCEEDAGDCGSKDAGTACRYHQVM